MKNILITLIGTISISFVQAQIPETLSFQGLLLETNGQAVTPGNYNFEFSIWDAETTGNLIWKETQDNIPVDGEGVYHVILGSGIAVTPPGIALNELAFDIPYWLEINVGGEILSPRINLSGSAYSLNDHLIDLSDGTLSGDKVGSGINGDNIADGTIDGSEIEDNSLTASDIAPDAIGNSELADIISISDLDAYKISIGGSTDNQRFEIYNKSGVRRVYQYVYLDGGYASYYGNNDLLSARIGTTSTRDRGQVTVYDTNGNSVASLYVNSSNQGVLSSTIKPFSIDHPSKLGYKIWYCAIEGPEAAAYIRGQIELINGEAIVNYEEHFREVANMEGLTINLTPHSADSKGLAAIERTDQGFKIKELFNGTGNYLVDWESKTVRKGLENFRVIRKEGELD